MSYPVRIGVQLQPQHSPEYRHIRDAVRRCRERVRAIVADVVAGRIGSGSGDAGTTPRG